MKNKFNSIFVFTLILVIGLGCNGLKEVTEFADKNAKPKTVTSKDGQVSLEIPTTWTDLSNSKDFPEGAIMFVGQPIQELYTVVIPDEKIDFADSADLDTVTKLVKDNTSQTIQDAKFTDAVSLKVNNFDAQRFEAGGVLDSLKIKYIFTIIETKDRYYQVISWTLNSRFDANKEKLTKVVESFKLMNKPPVKTVTTPNSLHKKQ